MHSFVIVHCGETASKGKLSLMAEDCLIVNWIHGEHKISSRYTRHAKDAAVASIQVQEHLLNWCISIPTCVWLKRGRERERERVRERHSYAVRE